MMKTVILNEIKRNNAGGEIMEQVIAAIITVAIFSILCHVVAGIMVKNDQRDRMQVDKDKVKQIKFDLAQRYG